MVNVGWDFSTIDPTIFREGSGFLGKLKISGGGTGKLIGDSTCDHGN